MSGVTVLLGANWASCCSAETLESAADIAVSDYLHKDNRESVIESLHHDRSAENATENKHTCPPPGYRE